MLRQFQKVYLRRKFLDQDSVAWKCLCTTFRQESIQVLGT